MAKKLHICLRQVLRTYELANCKFCSCQIVNDKCNGCEKHEYDCDCGGLCRREFGEADFRLVKNRVTAVMIHSVRLVLHDRTRKVQIQIRSHK